MNRKILLVCLLSLFLPGGVLAVPASQSVEFSGGKMGKVIFDGRNHAQSGNKCTACHPRMFWMKKGEAEIRYRDHNGGDKFCFGCHNGTVAFGPLNQCYTCHKRS